MEQTLCTLTTMAGHADEEAGSSFKLAAFFVFIIIIDTTRILPVKSVY